MPKSILKKDKKYTFSDYSELNHPTKEILAEFGYKYNFEELKLPETKIKIKSLEKLRHTYVKKLPFISLNSETAKREFYISPLLLEILDYINAEINVEYPLDAGANLNGTVDYLLKYSSNILILEAKKGDLEKGFNQLAIELIAMDRMEQYEKNSSPILYGAVTLGDIWRFGVLLREQMVLKKDMHAYIIPSDLEKLLTILLGILDL